MAQSGIAGATSYEMQSDKDILEDVIKWIDYSREIKEFVFDRLHTVKEDGIWNKVSYDFQMTVNDCLMFTITAVNDFIQVKRAIENESITDREVELLIAIGRNAIKLNNDFGKYYNYDSLYWHDYNNLKFEIIEEIYSEARDYCATLMDAGNAASRLMDYRNIQMNTININGNITESQIQCGTVNSEQAINNSEIHYDEILESLNKIYEYTKTDMFQQEFELKSNEFIDLLVEAIEEASKKKNSSNLKRLIGLMREMAVGIASGIIASGIANELLKYK